MESFITELSSFFKWLLVSSIQVSVLVCLILAIKAVVRRRLEVRWHYWLWLLLLARMVIPWAPQSSFSIFTLISQSKKIFIAEQTPEVIPAAATLHPTIKTAPDVKAGTISDLPKQDLTESVSETSRQIQSATAGNRLPSLKVVDMFSLLWFAIVSGLAVFALACNFRLWRIIKSQRPLTEGRILDLLEDCKSKMGIQTILGIVVTDKIKSPALFGVIRPRLLLPKGMLETLSAEQLRYIFLHELAHLKRHDIYLGWLMVGLQVLHWFNPLVWLAFSQMRADRELACDSLVLSTTGADKSQAYGQTLVNLFRDFSGLQYVPGIAGVLENKSQLKRRITMIARFKKGSYKWSILAVAVLAVFACVALTNAQAETQPENKEPRTLAKEFVELLVKGQFGQAVKGFDATMEKSMPADKLAQTWRTITGQASLFKQQLGTRLEKFLGSDIVFVTCVFEKGPMDVKVVYDSNRKVSGLWFVPTPQEVLRRYQQAAKSAAGEEKPKSPGKPKVVSTYPKAFANDVSPELKKITVTFDQSMMNLSWSWVGGGETFPEMQGQPRYDSRRMTCTLPVRLQPGKFYFIGINSEMYKNFQTEKGIAAVPYVILFATKDSQGNPTAIPENFIEEAKRINSRSTQAETLKPPARTATRIPTPIAIIMEDLPVDKIATNDKDMTIESLKTKLGPPDKETEKYLSYEKQNGLGFYIPDYLKTIHLNPGFTGHLENGISMDSTLEEIFEAFGQPQRIEETENLNGKWEHSVLYKQIDGSYGRISYGDVTFHLRNDKINQMALGQCYLISAEAYNEEEINTAAPKTKNFQSLIDSAKPGSAVVIPDGIYTEPIEIKKSLKVKGQSKNCVIEITDDIPAIFVNTAGKGEVTIEGMTIRWQLATSNKNTELPFFAVGIAVGIKDSRVKLKDCDFEPLGNFKRSPVAVKAVGFSKVDISTCRFEGFGFAVFYDEGTAGGVQDSLITNCQSQGITIFSGATVDIAGNIIAGSKKHAVRNTGGTLRMKDNLIINNANRGVYLGNKTAKGTISNNIIIANGTGISAFARSRVIIANNIIADSSYAGIGFRDSCGLQIRNNIFKGNQRGWIMFKEGERNNNGCQRNTFWQNKVDAENFQKTGNSILADPGFVDSENGDFSLKPGPALEHKQGLTNPQILKILWEKWKTIDTPTSDKGKRTTYKVVAPTSKPPTKTDKLTSENLAAEGWDLWRQLKLVKAEEKFKQAVEMDSKNEGAYQGLGWAQLNQGKKLNARDSFEKCIGINPKNSAALNGLGWIADGQGKKAEAISWWEKAVSAHPGATASLNGLTKVYMERKDYDKAVKYYQMWLDAEPDNAQAKSGLAKAKSATEH
ncbi:MAG: right-handed parallel beta-helix repeat-containing protein [Sedimentisphaerales bacterium]|nr:right-handed parallel beta-helix repeat-containing protein [Sedimentisphaerales bacterium]